MKEVIIVMLSALSNATDDIPEVTASGYFLGQPDEAMTECITKMKSLAVDKVTAAPEWQIDGYLGRVIGLRNEIDKSYIFVKCQETLPFQ